MRLDGYVRVSRVAGRSGESFISPHDQRARISAFAKAQGHEVVEWFEDLDVSGSKLDRPGLQAAIARVESGETGGIAVAALDRFARSVIDAAETLRRLEDAGGVLVSVKDSLDTSTPVGRFARTMMLAIAELELERVRENWSTAHAHAVDRGVHVAATTPFGYHKRDDGRLEPDPETEHILRELFTRRASGSGCSELADYLNVAVPKKNGGVWLSQTVRRILGNKVYLGHAFHGAHVNDEAHTALVSMTEWEAAQAALQRAPNSRPREKNGEGALLGGLIRCAACRQAMSVRTDHDRGARHYRCRGKSASGRCKSQASVNADATEEFVEKAFLAALDGDGVLADAAADTAKVDAAENKFAEAERQLATYRDADVIDVIGAKSYRKGLEARARAVDDARRELSEARQASALPATEISGDLREAWPDLSITEKRELLSSFIDAIMVRTTLRTGRRAPIEERAIILWRGEGPDDLPRRGRIVPLKPFVWPDDKPAPVGVATAQHA